MSCRWSQRSHAQASDKIPMVPVKEEPAPTPQRLRTAAARDGLEWALPPPEARPRGVPKAGRRNASLTGSVVPGKDSLSPEWTLERRQRGAHSRVDRNEQGRRPHTQAEGSPLWTRHCSTRFSHHTEELRRRAQACSPACPACGAWVGVHPGLGSGVSRPSPGTRMSRQPLGQHTTTVCLGGHKGSLSVCELLSHAY